MTLFRSLKRRFGATSRRVTVRAHVPWYWRWLGVIAVGAFVVGVGWTAYDYGMELAGFRQSEAARAIVVSRRLGRLSNCLPVVVGTLFSQTLLNVLGLFAVAAIAFAGTPALQAHAGALALVALVPALLLVLVLLAPWIVERTSPRSAVLQPITARLQALSADPTAEACRSATGSGGSRSSSCARRSWVRSCRRSGSSRRSCDGTAGTSGPGTRRSRGT